MLDLLRRLYVDDREADIKKMIAAPAEHFADASQFVDMLMHEYRIR